MPKARDLMTQAVVVCSPTSTLAEAARLMRDHNIGDVLVVDGDDLVGIITDRDITVQATARDQNPQDALVQEHMNTDVVTGEPGWKLDRVTETMGKHQIRRLPIVEKGRVVGILSLGDVALRQHNRSAIAESLNQISEPSALHVARVNAKSKKGRILASLFAGTILTMLLSPKRGRRLVGEWLSSWRQFIPVGSTR